METFWTIVVFAFVFGVLGTVGYACYRIGTAGHRAALHH